MFVQMESSTASLTFKGSIPEAIVEAKNKRKLFLVYISGKLDSYNPLLIVCLGFSWEAVWSPSGHFVFHLFHSRT